MKKWLTILVFLLTAAIALADGDNHRPSRQAPLPTAVLSQDNGHTAETVPAPMLAIPGQAPMHFCGTEQTPGKGNRPGGENPATGVHSHTIYTHTISPRTMTAIDNACQLAIRSTERYIYFIQRIII